ncbi:Serpentine Receptor, class H [Caenorhabditis elegans]|uniref:Serpentine Receptor, class H n=1 Tax=Caenorhabditis elegans TaxID=6239 RepID=Q94303_CAEEL|nr:Serpentine Receptor, class H [Caenorhabditis elegans]CCD70902.1 Serpentine Receptor, class H [Caenorhabditis elegans]|eukprot:NP_504011.1 Serpentine Receptor, class H [Caenorhabditis elegans]
MTYDFCTSTFYLYTADFQRLFLHYFGFLAIPVHVYGAYCIIFHTPSSMKSVKLSLLNFHFFSCFFDLGLSFLTTPYILFPALAGYPLGVLKDFGVRNEHQVYFMLLVGAYMLVAIILVFENRLLMLVPTVKFWKAFRVPWFIAHLILVTVFLLPIYSLIPDQEVAKNSIRRIAPCIPLYVNVDLVFILFIETGLFMRTTGVLILLGFIETWILAFITNEQLGKQINLILSKRTVELHRKFQKAFITQLTIPIIILIIPIIYVGVTSLLYFHNQAINNFIVIIVSSHGFFSTIVMICIHVPYREFTLRWLTVLAHVRMENLSSVRPSNNIT